MAKRIEDLAGLKSTTDLSKDLGELVKMMSLIKDVKCPSEVEPMISPVEHSVGMDSLVEPQEDDLPSREVVLCNASKVKGGFFAIPKIIDK